MKLTYAGLRIDDDEDRSPRFPESQVALVRSRIRGLLSHLQPSVVVGSAAAGADLIVAEEALKLSLPVQLIIPGGVKEFKSVSVADRGEHWDALFDRVIHSCGQECINELAGPSDDYDSDYFRSVNRHILDHAQRIQPDEVLLGLGIVPDELRGTDNVTADFIARVETSGAEVVAMDPGVSSEQMTTAFVAMPFGEKEDPKSGRMINCDRIFELMIVPALEDADFNWERADEQMASGAIHVAMIESIAEADVVIVDTVTYNSNVFYELGLRHVFADKTTLLIGPEDTDLPFDVNLIRQKRYPLSDPRVTDQDAVEGMARLRESLHYVKEEPDEVDSPVYQWFEIDRPRVQISEAEPEKSRFLELSDRVSRSHRLEASDIDALFVEIGEAEISDAASSSLRFRLATRLLERGNYRNALRKFDALQFREGDALYGSWMQKKALTLQRVGFEIAEKAGVDGEPDQYWERSEAVLGELLDLIGDDPETCGIAGGVAKRRSLYAFEKGEESRARVQLQRALNYYRRGFRSDPTDYYTGINLVSLLRLQIQHIRRTDRAVKMLREVLPVVDYMVERAKEREGGFWPVVTAAEVALNKVMLEIDDVSIDEMLGQYESARGLPHPEDWDQSVLQSLRYFTSAGDPETVIIQIVEVFSS